MLTLLITGIYMTATNWGQLPWIALGLLGMSIMAILGGRLTGRRLMVLARTLPVEDGSVSPEFASQLQDPALRLSLWLRTALGLGVIFLMTVKPGLALSVAILPIAAGAGLLGASRSRSMNRGAPVSEPAG